MVQLDLTTDIEVLYRDVKNYSGVTEISGLSAARQHGQPMHSQSANFGKYKLNSLNLAPFLLLNPVGEIFERTFDKTVKPKFSYVCCDLQMQQYIQHS